MYSSPPWFFTSLLLSRTWLLFIMAAASREQASALLNVFYPLQSGFYAGLALGALPLVFLLHPPLRSKLPRWLLFALTFALSLVDIANQVWMLKLQYWQFHPGLALQLWLCAMASILLLKDLWQLRHIRKLP